ncbi:MULTISPECIES: phosphotransferase [unclassified Cryobacterium]|uniref:phosphotransferase n=1 Tax=unclassified Cryobacterium TaxID=2649013 RepID=UPI0014479DAF|nr:MULTISPECIES: phosphotransferase [unclassified Cryobacterium]
MARSHLTLAALATAAVPGLEVSGARAVGSGVHGDYESALISGADGRYWMIRLPTSERAEAEQSADLVALRALSAGVRGRLPFDVTTYAGQTPISGTRAVVYEFVRGRKIGLGDIPAGEGLAESIGRAIAAIHALPTSFVADAGLPVLTPADALRTVTTIMDRASATGLVPAALLSRWETATEDSALWQYAPAVVNGALTADSFLVEGSTVTGLLGWQALSVGDPARDLFWLLGSPHPGVADSAIDAYQLARGTRDRQLGMRAMLYAELELAKWLLHGTQVRSTEIVDDAVGMLHNLLDRVQGDMSQKLTHETMPVLAVDEVERLLDSRQA